MLILAIRLLFIQLSTLLLLLFLLLVVLLQLPPFVVVLVSGCCCPKRPVLRQQCFKMALPESRGNKTTEGKTQRFPDSSMLTLSLEENPIKNLTRPNVLDHGENHVYPVCRREKPRSPLAATFGHVFWEHP